jgi:hypothetical protein
MISRVCSAITRAQVLFVRWGIRALLPAWVLFAVLAAAQEEWQRQDSVRPHDFVHDSQLTDSLSVQLPAGSRTSSNLISRKWASGKYSDVT